MKSLSRPQKDKVVQLRTVTGASERVALEAMKAVGWASVEAAVEHYYSTGGGGGGGGGGSTAGREAAENKKAEAFFLEYKDEHADAVLAEGIARLCDDLGVDPSDPVMLALSWRIGAATMCEWSRDEFVHGVKDLGCAAGADALKAQIPALRREMADPSKFAEMYAYAFGWAAEKGQKCLQLDTALAMWRLLLGEGTPRPGGPWPLLGRWLDFLSKAHAGRAVGRDTWLQLLEFVRTVKADMSDYDENGAWPYLLDEFVEACRKEGVAAAAAS